ncbi:winged helix-turn-helix transcriptional regulator [Halovenus rubra]|uniref:Winged helix-turn-helix transcriptional regulator n=2 Tax=Halovenus rubra TaxID=869890 RepID=A0ACC7E0L4_9EURY|nr:winged helix-turn-helix transcriptional regulator [Halovenus rubra]
MTQADDRILEALEDSGLRLSPRILAANVDYSRHYIARRLAKLEEGGLIEKVDEGLYEITIQGRKYLSGDLSAEDLEFNEK